MNRHTPIDAAIVAWRMWAKNPYGEWASSAERITKHRRTHLAYVMAEYCELAIDEVLKGQRSGLRLDIERDRLKEARLVYSKSPVSRIGIRALEQIASHCDDNSERVA